MKLSIRIPLATTGLLFMTLMLNFIWLQFSLSRHIVTYVQANQAVSNDTTELSPDKLEALFLVSTALDSREQTDYQHVISQLSEISRSLQDLSTNPDIYVHTEDASQHLGTGIVF